MTSADKAFTGSIPEFYDTYMVPMLFETYAADLATRIAALAPASVLETAAGSGVVPRALARRLPPQARYVATDLNQPMLDHAARKQPPAPQVQWRQADALALPFAEAEFETVICQYGVMFYPDRRKGYGEARRVLAPGGRYVFSTWDRIEANGFAEAVTAALALEYPDDPPRFMARTPHGYFDPEAIRADLTGAGFTDISIEPLEADSHAASARYVATAFCQGTPLRSTIEALSPGALDSVTGRVATVLEERYGSGPIADKMRAFIVTALK